MGYLKQCILLAFIGCLLAMSGCSTSGSTSQSKSVASEEELSSMTLEDHLRRINGVRIQGSDEHAKVFVGGSRGISNISRGMGDPDSKSDMNVNDSNKRQPLFVVDGQKVGRDYSSVRDMFSAGDIKSVRLLSESEASQYGSEGGSGVIVITTISAVNNDQN